MIARSRRYTSNRRRQSVLAVAKIVKGGKRLRSKMFAEHQSHYLFEDCFGRSGKGNGKGKMEGLVGFVRRNFMTPMPVAENFDAFNVRLRDACIKRRQAILRGHTVTHLALGLSLATCQKGGSVAFTTAAALVHEPMEARDERRLRTLQKHLDSVKLLIVDELGCAPFTAVSSELLFEDFSQRYERGSTLVTSNLPLDEWTSIFGSERLTGALLDRLTHHVHIPEMNGENYRLATSKRAQRRSSQETNQNPKSTNDGDPKTDR
jgi:IstB-like ATP binding protein